MRILALCLIVISMMNVSCIKPSDGCRNKTVGSEEGTITAYAAANGINATRHSTGLYYEIINQGSGATPTTSSNIKVTYTGQLLSGYTFDQQTSPIELNLAQVIAGWQIGVPLIQKGGRIKLIVPSSLAYGCIVQGTIPANSILYFDITLVDVL